MKQFNNNNKKLLMDIIIIILLASALPSDHCYVTYFHEVRSTCHLFIYWLSQLRNKIYACSKLATTHSAKPSCGIMMMMHVRLNVHSFICFSSLYRNHTIPYSISISHSDSSNNSHLLLFISAELMVECFSKNANHPNYHPPR